MKRTILRKNARAAALGVAATAAALAVRAGTCIISGDPAAVATAGSASRATDGVALVTGTLTASVASPAFDVRDWTRLATPGVKLNTRPWRGGFLIVR